MKLTWFQSSAFLKVVWVFPWYKWGRKIKSGKNEYYSINIPPSFFYFQALVLRSNALTGPPTGFISWICLFGRTQWIFMRSHKVRHWPCLRPYLLKSSGQACFPDLTQHGSIPTCIIPSSIIPILHHCSSCHWDSMVSPG